MAEELLKLSIKDSFNTLDEKWLKNQKNTSDDKRFSTFFSPTLFSIKLNELLVNEGVVNDSAFTGIVLNKNILI